MLTSEQPLISVVISTLGRRNIELCLKSILSQTYKNYEIIVISKCPLKNLENISNMGKNLKIEVSPNLGLSQARNKGVALSHGQIIAFIDDDAVASPRWLENIVRGIKSGYDIVGGLILPHYLSTPPSWWDESRFGTHVSINKYSREIYGCNLAVTRKVFHIKDGFDHRLGRSVGSLLSGEETDFLQRAIRSGFKVKFIDEIKVEHLIPKDRLMIHWLIKRSWYGGISRAVITRINYPNLLLKKSIKALASFVYSLLSFPLCRSTSDRINVILHLSSALGFIYGKN